MKLFELEKVQEKANSELKKTKECLVAIEKAHDANADVVAMSLIKVDAARGKMDKALQNLAELQKVAQGSVY